VADDEALTRLQGIEHIVVVMMENRSFDHMLGYLGLPNAPDADGASSYKPIVHGLSGPEVNFNEAPDGRKIPITAFDADADDIQRRGEALQKRLDPDHSPAGVATQLGTKRNDEFPMDGFVKSFVESRKPTDNVGEDLWVVPMGYYTAKDLPTYDYLAHEYCVCDNWHSSIPGDTWPNRLYALAGTTGDRTHEDFLQRFLHLLPFKSLRGAPIFDVAAFPRQLDDHQWRWYSHDPATLRAADGDYRKFVDPKRDNFAYFDRKKLSVVTEAGEELIVGHDSFLDDAAKGELRDVSWIDPNFIDLSILDPSSNDDHPPTDIRAGQAFILEVYEALTRSPQWTETMLVIVYDEHGGFYDHVSPPPVDDGSGYATLGVRVPAIVAGPRVSRSVCHETFDHTVLMKTILTRFAPNPEQAIERMGQRVGAAPHLGVVLEAQPRNDIAPHDSARAAIDEWRTNARARRRAVPEQGPSSAPDGAGQPLVLQDFQAEFAQFALPMRHLLPPGQP
jgi:phospholipase C